MKVKIKNNLFTDMNTGDIEEKTLIPSPVAK